MKPSTGFAERLRFLRAEADLTQAELAKRAGMHLHGLIKLERGEREPQWASVLALAEALGVDCRAFVGSTDGQALGAGERGRPKKETGETPKQKSKRRK
jgi:transcriptional regulator with XRE-family HTH domain